MLARLGNVLYWVSIAIAILIVVLGFIFAVATSRIEGVTSAIFVFAVFGVVGGVVILAGRACRFVMTRVDRSE